MKHLNELILRYKNKGLLVDANILLLYFVGMYDPERIDNFKRTMAFSTDEFSFLCGFVQTFSTRVTTPNILTEVSNLCGTLPEMFFDEFATLIPSFQETYQHSASVSKLSHFRRFGLTDSGIIDLVRDRYLVLTDDLRLANYLLAEGADAINFNHLRDFIREI